MTKELEALAPPIVELIKKALDQRVGPLEQRVAAVEVAHSTLAGKALTAGGLWQRGQSYTANEVVVHDGSLSRDLAVIEQRDGPHPELTTSGTAWTGSGARC
jgi:hypothetical protein